MTTKSLALAVPTAALAFPATTVDTAWTFSLTGTNADGTPFSSTVDSNVPATDVDVPAGTTGLVLVITKNGISSLPSDPFDVPADVTVPVTVTLTVPDATQKATIALAAAPDAGAASTDTASAAPAA